MITLLCISHFAYLTFGVIENTLGANPIEVLTHSTGEWGLRLLLVTLAITPCRRLFGWNSLLKFRRFLGLWSFFYILCHFLIFIIFDHLLDIKSIVEDIIDRPYISFGFASFILLLPLAVTSFAFLQRKMGKAWLRLHQLVYVAAILGVVHFWWLVKADVAEPLIYGAILLLLLLIRLRFFYKKRYNITIL